MVTHTRPAEAVHRRGGIDQPARFAERAAASLPRVTIHHPSQFSYVAHGAHGQNNLLRSSLSSSTAEFGSHAQPGLSMKNASAVRFSAAARFAGILRSTANTPAVLTAETLCGVCASSAIRALAVSNMAVLRTHAHGVGLCPYQSGAGDRVARSKCQGQRTRPVPTDRRCL